MIKVLIVDDDKMVRKGLITTIPWEKYGMIIIGEAKNGEKALDFIESNEVDLLITDLAMPVMSGLELMRVVGEKHPYISMVVLTMHQDFEYIQDALRLGAIDYIAKIEMSSFDEALERVGNKLANGKGKRIVQDSPEDSTVDFTFESCLVLMTTDEKIVWNEDEMSLFGIKLPSKPDLLSKSFLVWQTKKESEEKQLLNLLMKINVLQHYMVLKVREIKKTSKRELEELLIQYNEKHYFYDFHPHNKILTTSIGLLTNNSDANEKNINKVKERMVSFNSIQKLDEFNNVLQELKNLHLPTTKLINLLYFFANEWIKICSPIRSKIELPEGIHFWYEVEEWFHTARNIICDSMRSSHFSTGVQESLTRAIRIIHEELANPVHASDVAKKVNMSRSYFSQCFKEFVGMTFNEYVRHVRIEKAKEYLLHTTKTIAWIAENTGYTDDKYFSRIFRKATGVLPSEYRRQALG
ncbi:helix-turn-helix domain-containing protein [Metabacillus schmidteae]|uniref:helix-turn-helix domain-containing protein n=1 Tax=Metabacillus schmidteae TaxID=2730405 RepID=UPI00158AC216|nr:helix-turn-helix domain-containing protein [Metabacillus schmidteae]